MNFSKRIATGAAIACTLASPSLWAQSFPARPLHFVNGAAPGSGVDIIARIVAPGMSASLGQQVIIDNRPGGSSNIAAEAVAKAAPDGYTLFNVTSTHALNASVSPDLKYNLLRDFAPVTYLVVGAHVVVVNPKLPARTIQELIKLAQSRPGEINYASAGVGTSAFLAAEKFKSRAGVNLTHVPYKAGSQALAAVASGEVGVMFASLAGTTPLISAGRIRAVAITAPKRMSTLADLPSVAESGFAGFQTGTLNGILAPARTPRAVIDTINKATLAALGSPDIARRLTELGYVIIGNSPDEFGSQLKEEVQDLAKMAKEFNLLPEG